LSVVPFPISCLNCDECSEAHIKADYDSKTVRCGKCKHVAKAEEYDEVDFVKACYYDSKPYGTTSGFKKHQETAYLSMLTDLERAKNENKHLDLKREELRLKEMELERQDNERNKQMEYDQKIEESRNSTQLNMLKIQNETTVAMTQLIDRVIPKKKAIEKYKESKAAINAMVAAQ
jgi:hypothetical protein